MPSPFISQSVRGSPDVPIAHYRQIPLRISRGIPAYWHVNDPTAATVVRFGVGPSGMETNRTRRLHPTRTVSYDVAARLSARMLWVSRKA